MKAGSIRPVLDASFFDDPADAVARNLIERTSSKTRLGRCVIFRPAFTSGPRASKTYKPAFVALAASALRTSLAEIV